jgi:flagellar biosynthetic protein FlhB
MADAPDKDSKTEEPTEKKIRDTVEKGKLPTSREAPILASFLAILAAALFVVPQNAGGLGRFLGVFLEKPEDWPIGTAADVLTLYKFVLIEAGRAIMAVVILLMLAGIVASALQNMPRFVLERIAPQASRISLAKGWNRLFGAQGFVEFAKSVGKLGLVAAVLVVVMSDLPQRMLSGMLTQPTAFNAVIAALTVKVITVVVFVMLVIAGFDIVWSRFHWFQELRMTRQEVKDEMKQAEGDPMVKSRRRSIARDRARQRMIAAVPTATLVIANPTHFAIALRYNRDKDSAPVVVAKGTDLIALKIREVAQEHGVPIFEEIALARSMYKQVSVDSVIPSQFYQAVAELVRAVYAAKGKTGRLA